MTAKRLVVLTICLMAASCKGGGDLITFKLVQPPGQKSVYSLKSDMKVDAQSLDNDRGTQGSEVSLTGVLETEATGGQTDGRWALTSKFANLDMSVNQQQASDMTADLVGRPFTVTFDKDGKVLEVSGMEDAMPGMLNQMMSQLSPTSHLPNRSVQVGESWPIEMVTPIEAEGAKFDQILKGTGTLKEVTDGQALIEFDYTLEMSTTDPGPSQMTMTGRGSGKATTRYDIEKARFVSNRTDMNLATSGTITMGTRKEQVKNNIVSSMQMDLVNK
jgi:Family of unknown function (DUF6263)